jgi:hypothetical protein
MLDTRDALRHALGLLLDPTPQNIDLSCSALSRATGRIKALQTVLEVSGRQPDYGLMQSAGMLRDQVGTIAKLLDCAALFHANIFQGMVLASCPAYLPAAAPESAELHVQLSA